MDKGQQPIMNYPHDSAHGGNLGFSFVQHPSRLQPRRDYGGSFDSRSSWRPGAFQAWAGSSRTLRAFRSLVAVGLALGVSFHTSKADITGFGGSGAGWSLNYAKFDGRPSVGADVLNITDESYHLANSAFHQVPQDIRGFEASFIWLCITSNNGYSPGDGFTFVVQRAGVGAYGGDGNQLGYGGMGHSVALAFNMMDEPTGKGVTLATNGVIGEYTPTAPVSLRANHEINGTVSYDGTVLSAVLTDLSSGDAFTKEFTVDIPGIVGDSTAYVGFTAGSGQAYGWQKIRSFSYQEIEPAGPELSIRVSQVELCWMTQTDRNYQLQYSTELDPDSWIDLGLPVAGTGSLHCATDAVAGETRRYYRVQLVP